uniref:Copper transport protein n=1 Tax=Panagrolaimus davidi TaxID=227884 RepID=A0A914P100_9BILA
MMMMMEMYFHFRIKEYILLKEWLPETTFAFVVSCFGIVLLSFSYESLKCVRALIFRSSLNEDTCCDAGITNQAVQGRAYPTSAQDPECECGESTVDSTKALPRLPKLMNLPLMMIAMTYNVPLFASMIFGHIIGYLFLGPLYEIKDEQKLCDCCG